MDRLQNQTPPVNTAESRDFQLLCRLYDYIFGAVTFDIDTIPNLNDPLKINDSMVELLCSKVGFFPKRTYDTKLLRYVISSFNHIMKYKGSLKGIKEAVATILKVERQYGAKYYVLPVPEDSVIKIFTTIKLYNKSALEEILDYITPIGFYCDIAEYDIKIYDSGKIVPKQSAIALRANMESISQIRGSDRIKAEFVNDNPYNFRTGLEDSYVGSYITSQVVGTGEISQGITGGIDDKDRTFGFDRNGTYRDTIDESILSKDDNIATVSKFIFEDTKEEAEEVADKDPEKEFVQNNVKRSRKK